MSTTTIELNALDRPLGGSPLGGSGDPSPGPSIPPTPARSLAGSARTSIDLRSLNGSARNSIDFRYPSPPPSAITTTPKANYEYPPRPPSISNSNHAAAPSLSRRASEEDVGSVPADEIAALPPVDGGRRAWTFLAAATFIETTVWGLPYTVGVFHQYWQTRMFPGEESTLTLAATLQTALMYMSTAALGPMFAAFPHRSRAFQIVGLIVSTAALIGSAFVTSASHLLLTFGILYPFAGALYLPCATLLYEWFYERRGLANGILFSGTGVGGTVLPIVISALLNGVGYRATMLALGIAFGASNLVAMLFIRRRVPLPPRTTRLRDRLRSRLAPKRSKSASPSERLHDGHSARHKAGGIRGALKNADLGIVRTWAFWCGFLVLLLTSMGNFNPTLWIPTFADNVGARPDGTALVSIMNAASVPGNLLVEWVSDRASARATIGINCLVASVIVLTLWGFGTSSSLLILFSVFWGFSALSFVSLWGKMITRICKDRPSWISLVFSMFAVLRGVGNLTSGPISTKLLQTAVFKGAHGAYGKTNFGAVLIYTAATIFCGGAIGVFFPGSKS